MVSGHNSAAASRMLHDDDDYPSILALWVPGRPPTTNGMNKQHPKTRSRFRREWKAETDKALTAALASGGLDPLGHNERKAWNDAGREQRDIYYWEHHDLFRARTFRDVTVEATPWYESGRSVPDPDGIATAAKWSLDALVESGILISDTRHHVMYVQCWRARIEPMIDGPALSLIVKAVS